MSEDTITMILWGIFAVFVITCVLFLRYAKTPEGRKGFGGGMIMMAMFSFAKFLEPSRVDVEEAQPKRREGENPETKP